MQEDDKDIGPDDPMKPSLPQTIAWWIAWIAVAILAFFAISSFLRTATSQPDKGGINVSAVSAGTTHAAPIQNAIR